MLPTLVEDVPAAASQNKMEPGGAVEVDIDNVISNITSLLTVVAPSHGSLLDSAASTSSPKVDDEVCQILSQDIEKVKSNSTQIDAILKQFLNFAEGGGKSPKAGGGRSVTSGDTARLAATTPVLSPLLKLEWLGHICQENSVALDNLSTVLNSDFFNLFPAAIYNSLDCLLQLSILWQLFGAYVDVQALASGANDVLLDHEHPQVVHAKQEIASVLETRQKILGSSAAAPVSVTEILLGVILPSLNVILDRLQ